MKNYKVGANRNWKAIASSQKWANRTAKPDTFYVVGGSNGRLSEKELAIWEAKLAGVAVDQIKIAKDGRKYYLIDGKAHFNKGSKPTR